MKIILEFLKLIKVKDSIKPQLGRWNIDTCSVITNRKIDLSNEDHCGPCGQYILDKTKKDSNKNVNK